MDKKKSKVTEYCSECETEIELLHDIETEGYKVKCPNCGARLMLCDECQHRGKEGSYMNDCDYDSQKDTCRFNKRKVGGR